ncbi:MAG: bacillolysin [Chloroflexota bacterium]
MRRRFALIATFGLTLSLLPLAGVVVLAKTPTGCITGEGLVFNPNPVVTSGNLGLTDQNDADYPALNNERVSVPLIGLDGSGYLRGTWASVTTGTGDLAYETDCTFDYSRHDDRFEQVMAYYWVTKSQLYLRSLGFGVTPSWPAINADQQAVRIDQWGQDNSFATDHPKDEMRFGKGGVDDAEDAEVILHELGHQIHFSQSATFFASNEAGSISEGFGDYWAADVSEWAAGVQPDPKCIAEWDSVTYTAGPVHCLRRLDSTRMYPSGLTGEVHRDGTIWSHALWNLRSAIGANHADTSILWAQFGWTGTTMPDLADLVVDQVRSRYGNKEANKAIAAFHERGIL